MSVKPARVTAKSTYTRPILCAADVLESDHPLHKTFIKWIGTKEPTKRQARKFLQNHPHYNEVKQG